MSKIIILLVMILMTGCNSKVEKPKEVVVKHPILKTKEELKNEMIEDIKKEREQRNVVK